MQDMGKRCRSEGRAGRSRPCGVPPPCRGAASAHRAMILLDDWPLFAVLVGGMLVVGLVLLLKLM